MPVEIPGVNNMEFLKASVDAVRESQGASAYDTVGSRRAREACTAVDLDQAFSRGVNEGFQVEKRSASSANDAAGTQAFYSG